MRHISVRESFPFEPSIFGKSVSGIPLEVWLPDGENQTDLLVMAGIHGAEPETTKLLSSALRTLEKKELKYPVVLCANPDGIMRGRRSNLNGVDLNRNFPAIDWSLESLMLSWIYKGEKEVEISTGEHPASEPETKALIDLIDKLRPKTIISIHAPAGLIDDPEDTQIGAWLAQKTGLPHVTDWDIVTPGSMGTWGKENNIPIITYELPDASIQNIRKIHEPVLVDLLRGMTTS